MSYSYINTLISDTEENFELKSLFEDIDKTIEMLEEEAPVSPQINSASNISPNENEKIKKQQNKQKLKNLKNMSNNPEYVQAYIKPNSLGPRYVLVEVERFRNMTPEECAKFTDDPMIAKRALPASTQNISPQAMNKPNNVLAKAQTCMSMMYMVNFLTMVPTLLYGIFVKGKAVILGILGFVTGPNRAWFYLAAGLGAVLLFLVKIIKRFKKKNNQNVTVSKIANESVYLTVIEEDNDIPFKRYFEILEESTSDINKIGNFFNTGFDRVADACKTIEGVPTDGNVGILRNVTEKLAGFTNYALIKSKASLASNNTPTK